MRIIGTSELSINKIMDESCHDNRLYQIHVAMATVSRPFNLFLSKNIKLNYHYLQSSKLHKYLKNVILSELINAAFRYAMLQRHSAYSTCK